MIDQVIEVTEVSRGLDPISGKKSFSVSLGFSASVDEAARKRFESVGQKDISPEVGVRILTLNIIGERVLPYLLGSRWRLVVAEDGTITLKEAAQ